MALNTHMYMAFDNQYGYLKVLCRPDDAEVLQNMGWRREQPVKPKADADKGDPVIGSLDWHRAHLEGMDQKDDIVAYAKELTGMDVHKGGGLDTVVEKAMKAIEAHGNG